MSESGGAGSDTRLSRKKRERRAALRAAAMELVQERGLYKTRVEDVTERADMAKGAFYTYYPSKDALVAELLAEAVRVLQADYLGKMNGVAGPARIEELAKLHGDFLDEYPTFALLLHQVRGLLLVPTTSDVSRLRELLREYLDVLSRVIRPGKQRTAADREVAAVLAGGVAGARSFNIAAGFKPSRLAPAVLARGAAAAVSGGKTRK